RLDPEGDEQHELEDELGPRVDLREALGQLREVDRARGGVDERDRREEEDRGQDRDDDVDRARPYPLAGPAEGDEHEARDEEDLEADVEVEEVAGEEGVGDARGEDEV